MTPWIEELDHVLRSWLGTPWMAGQCCRGVGVDCRYFCVGVLDELYGIDALTAGLPPRLPQNMPLHDPAWALRAMRDLLRRYPHARLHAPSAGALEPGDVLIARRGAADSPGHVMIVGKDPRIAFHAATHEVCITSVAGNATHVLFAWRMAGKEKWKRRSL